MISTGKYFFVAGKKGGRMGLTFSFCKAHWVDEPRWEQGGLG